MEEISLLNKLRTEAAAFSKETIDFARAVTTNIDLTSKRLSNVEDVLITLISKIEELERRLPKSR